MTNKGYSFGTFGGVFTPSILTIIGVIMYLRFGWVLGNLGLTGTLLTVTLGSAVTLVTGLAISALATNMKVETGGAYFMLSRSFGVEAGGAIGIPLFASQAISVAFYAAGFSESLAPVLQETFNVTADPRHLTVATIVVLTVLASVSASLALRAQYVIMAFIALSLISFFGGSSPDPATLERVAAGTPKSDFWAVFAVFFPAVTGILAGVGMSGDLKNARRSIPLGTIAAVLTGYAIYMAVPIFFNRFVPDADVLRGDMMLFAKVARFRQLVLFGMWAATLSSALGCLLAAPRTLQALARDRVLPRFLGRGYGETNDPRIAAAVTFLIAIGCSFIGSVDLIAPILTMINLTTYGLLNFSAGLESFMGNPAWRPSFRVPSFILFLGGTGCLALMFMIGPGEAMICCALVGGIYWMMSRRSLRARWGDMRDGLAAMLVRIAVRRLDRSDGAGRSHSWRPNLLVFAGMSSRSKGLLALAGAVSRNRSLLTLAAVLPNEYWNPDREAELRKSMYRDLKRQRMEACVTVEAADDFWHGCAELVRSYGFGPIVPNTILLDMPKGDEGMEGLAALSLVVARGRRNLVLRQEGTGGGGEPTRFLDVWWRGRFQNGGFMLALAWLIADDPEWRGSRIRLCSICGAGENPEKIRSGFLSFLSEVRVNAEVLVLPADERAPFERITETSADSALILLGLPPLQQIGEASPAIYAERLKRLSDAARPLARTLFVLGAEEVDFKGIFQR